jgi:hypothetical protein
MSDLLSELPTQLIHWIISLLPLALSALGLYLQRRDKRVRVIVSLHYDPIARLPTGRRNAVNEPVLALQPGVWITIRNIGKNTLTVSECGLKGSPG